MQNESEAGNATRKSQKQRLTKKKIKTTRRLVGAASTIPPKSTEKVGGKFACIKPSLSIGPFTLPSRRFVESSSRCFLAVIRYIERWCYRAG